MPVDNSQVFLNGCCFQLGLRPFMPSIIERERIDTVADLRPCSKGGFSFANVVDQVIQTFQNVALLSAKPNDIVAKMPLPFEQIGIDAFFPIEPLQEHVMQRTQSPTKLRIAGGVFVDNGMTPLRNYGDLPRGRIVRSLFAAGLNDVRDSTHHGSATADGAV